MIDDQIDILQQLQLEDEQETFPSSWQLPLLKSIVEPRGRREKPAEFPELPFIGLEHVEAHTMRLLGSAPASDMKSAACKFEPGDVIYGRLRSYLNKVCKLSFPGLCSAEFIVFPKQKHLDNTYLQYFLNSKRFVFFASHIGEGDRPRVDFEQIGEIAFPLPPLNEQHRIVAKIEALTERSRRAKAALDAILPLLEQFRQSVLAAAFRGDLTADWREKNIHVGNVDDLLASTEIPQQPRGGREAAIQVIPGRCALSVNHPSTALPTAWRWVPLLRIARQETGHTPSRKEPIYWDGDVPWIGIKDAREYHGKVIYSTFQHITPAGLANSAARILPRDTVCLSRTASVGYVVIMGRDMATSQDFATWTCTSALEPKYLMYALLAEEGNLKKFGEGSTHTTIYFPEIRALHIALAPIEEQREIVERIEARLYRIEKLVLEAERTQGLFKYLEDAILAKAFRGELVSQDPNDEPASVLLERIREERQAAGAVGRKGTGRRRKKNSIEDKV